MYDALMNPTTKTNKRVVMTLDLTQAGAAAVHKQIGTIHSDTISNGETIDSSGVYKAYQALGQAITDAQKPRFYADGQYVRDADSYGDTVATFHSLSNPYKDSYDLAVAYANTLNNQ